MTAPAPASVPPVPAVVTWPAVFDGIGALVVRCDLDPAALVAKINAKSGAGALSWIAPKVNGADITAWPDIKHAVSVWRSLGLHVGVWVYCDGPPSLDIQAWTGSPIHPVDFVVYDVEREYKSDEGGQYQWAAALVSQHGASKLPVAVTSYGGYKTSIDFASFARAGWPVLCQVYDSFKPGDEWTYVDTEGGVYPSRGVHKLMRSLLLLPGEAVYRPEGIDG